MGYTKRKFILDAFDELVLADYVFDLTDDEIQSQARRLERMMADWNAKGIRLGYSLSSDPDNIGLDTETDVPDSANEAIVCNLAVRIAPSFGKQVSMETKQTARIGYQTLLSRATLPNEMQLPGTMPSGAGNKYWRDVGDPFLQEPSNPIDVGPDSVLELN